MQKLHIQRRIEFNGRNHLRRHSNHGCFFKWAIFKGTLSIDCLNSTVSKLKKVGWYLAQDLKIYEKKLNPRVVND